MSSSIDLENVEVLVNGIIKKGVAYAVGLITYLYSSVDFRYNNVVATLKPAFGVTVAEKVYNDLADVFGNIDIYTKVVIEGKEVLLIDYLRQRVLKEDVIKVVYDEAEKRLQHMPEEDRKVLSVASTIINALKTESCPAVEVHATYPSWINGIRVSSSDEENFSKLVSSVLGIDIPDVRAFFCRYLLGFIDDSASRRYYYYGLEIYPFAIPYIEALAKNVSKYITVYDKDSIRSKLNELYQKGGFAKLAVIMRSLSTRQASEFLSQFFGKPYKWLCDEVIVEGIISKCFINPLICEHVKEALYELYRETLSKLMDIFRSAFEREGYGVNCLGDCCIIAKALSRPMYIYLYPWPMDIPALEDFPGAIKAVVVQGMPAQSVLQARELQYYGSIGYLWLFVDKNRIAIASNTYRHDDHYELFNILKNHFTLEVIGTTPKELEALLASAKPVTIVSRESISRLTLPVERFGARDPLEDVVASVLKSLGFSIKVEYKVISKAGTEIEVDVWGEKIVGDMKFVVYASCKNWDRPIEVGVVREEFGRILQLPYIPHVRVIVAPTFTESAKKEALASGFVVVEAGEKAIEENLEKVYQRVYEKLNRLFMGVAPKWMQELAEKARSIAEEIKKLSEELEKAAGIR